MIRHIVSWNFKEGLSDEQNRQNALKIKSELEGLAGIVEGIIEIKVYIDLLPSSTKNIVLDSLFETKEALDAYQVHPLHKQAGAFVGTVVQERVCLDYCV